MFLFSLTDSITKASLFLNADIKVGMFLVCMLVCIAKPNAGTAGLKHCRKETLSKWGAWPYMLNANLFALVAICSLDSTFWCRLPSETIPFAENRTCAPPTEGPQ